MIETGDGSCITDEVLHPFWIGGDFARQEFDSDSAIQLARVMGQVHLPHPTRTEVRTDFVPPEFYTFREWHRRERRLTSSYAGTSI